MVEHLTDEEYREFIYSLAVQPSSRRREDCTGVAARWCPIHGDCECDQEDDHNDPECPLHSPTSTHADQ